MSEELEDDVSPPETAGISRRGPIHWDVKIKSEGMRLDRYLAMYANDDTREMKDDVKQGITELFRRAHAAGVLREPRVPEFAP